MNAIARVLGMLILNIAVSVGMTAGSSTSGPAGPADASNSTAAFQKLSGLVGRWEATSPMGNIATTYELVSGGSVLLERLEVDGKDPMVTVYHLDGNRLVLEHYCHAGNQPRLQAKPFSPESNEIDFDFVSVTNLTSPNAGHMHQLALRFNSADEVAADWTWSENGKLGGKNVSLLYHRVK
jgi:hypothetical protein